MTKSGLEKTFEYILLSEGIGYEKEYRFYEKRKWRFDFAFPEKKVGVEIQGGLYINGRHTRGKYLEEEYEKLNYAALLGWRIIFATSKSINDGTILNFVKEILYGKDNQSH